MNFSAIVVDVDGELSRLFAQLSGLSDVFVMHTEQIGILSFSLMKMLHCIVFCVKICITSSENILNIAYM